MPICTLGPLSCTQPRNKRRYWGDAPVHEVIIPKEFLSSSEGWKRLMRTPCSELPYGHKKTWPPEGMIAGTAL